MALIRFETNGSAPAERVKIITQNLTRAVARFTGEPEAGISVEVAGDRKMRMAKSDEPIAHVEIRNVEIPKSRARELTQAICPIIEDTFGIHDDHIYIAVISTRNSMWRVNGDFKQ
jgi:phenylpyruvate tautomerase PptA (4-oxalocrotonate tautomerase family)